jgi:predicted permease
VTTLGQDLRYALRTLRQNPGFAAVAIATLAIGIGANAAIFSVVHTVLLKPLPFARADELVRVTSDLTRRGGMDVGLSAPELFDYRERAGVFESMSGLYPITANVTGGDRPERVETLLVDVEYFDILGVKAQVGRLFEKRDYDPGIADFVVLSDGFWRRRFGADPGVIGKPLRIDDDLCTILGVLPPGFRHPGKVIETDVEVWAPSGWLGPPFQGPNRRAYFLQGALGRLKPGVTPEAAQARLDAVAADLRREYASDYPEGDGWAPRLVALQDDLVGGVRPALVVLLAAVGLVLLIGCANVANLQLARASARRREIAVRQALGASRGRLVRQLLTESVVVALAGGLLGLGLAAFGVDLLMRLSPASILRLPEVRIDRIVLLFTLGASLLTGLVFGIVPALSGSASALGETLNEGSRGASGRRGKQIRSLLVVAEFALALVLLVGAGLLVRTLWSLQRVDVGFESKDVTTASLWLPQPDIRENGRYNDNAPRAAFYRKALDRIRSLPGVTEAAGATRVPFNSGRFKSRLEIEGRDAERDGTAVAEGSSASTRYFATLGIPLKSGRDFDERDIEGGAPVMIVSESFARRYFPGEDPIGKRLRFPGLPQQRQVPASAASQAPPWMSIVGVVGDVRGASLALEAEPAFYRPLLQATSPIFTFVVRGTSPPSALGRELDANIRALDPELPVFAVRTMDEAMASTVAERRFAMQLLALFAAAALALSAVGIYGVVAYGVAQRTREIGIRMALGARPADVRRMLLAEGGKLAAVGVAAGLAGAFLLTRAMGSLLFGVGPRDPLTLASVPAILAAVALAATFIPARRASRVNPVTALRSE